MYLNKFLEVCKPIQPLVHLNSIIQGSKCPICVLLNVKLCVGLAVEQLGDIIIVSTYGEIGPLNQIIQKSFSHIIL